LRTMSVDTLIANASAPDEAGISDVVDMIRKFVNPCKIVDKHLIMLIERTLD
jgi:hypothetical protein